MELLQYTDEHRDFRQRLRDFLAREVTPNVDQWEKDGIEPKSVWRKMGQNGFLCMDIPPEYGGMGGDFLYSIIVTEEISHTLHTGLAVALHSDIVVPYISAFASEELKHKYLPGCVSGDIISAIAMTEPGAGSDLAGLTTTAEEQGDEVVIKRMGNAVVLLPKDDPWKLMFDAVKEFPEDLTISRNQPELQERDSIE